MKRILRGRKYDTDTARLVKEWSNCDNYGSPYTRYDNQFYLVQLYRKQTGEYFLYGETTCTQKILPLDADDAATYLHFEPAHDPQWDRNASVHLEDTFGWPGEWDDSQ